MSPLLDAGRMHEQLSPHIAQDIVREGYVNYHQALALGFVPTPQSLYTVIVTTIRDIHHPDAYNVAYLLGWLAAYYQSEQHTLPGEQQLQMATVHLRLASALHAQMAQSASCSQEVSQ